MAFKVNSRWPLKGQFQVASYGLIGSSESSEITVVRAGAVVPLRSSLEQEMFGIYRALIVGDEFKDYQINVLNDSTEAIKWIKKYGFKNQREDNRNRLAIAIVKAVRKLEVSPIIEWTEGDDALIPHYLAKSVQLMHGDQEYAKLASDQKIEDIAVEEVDLIREFH